MAVLGLDIGGTKLAAGLVSADGELLRAAPVPTPDDPWPAVVALLDEVAGDDEVSAVGVGCGGPMRWPEGIVSPLNIPRWRDFPLRDRLAERWPDVRVHNDAVCFALGEHRWGAGRGVDHLLGVVVSTGVGGGIVRHGRAVDGASGNAGHVGHVVVEPGGPVCGCGVRGCVEAVARGPAVVARARARGLAVTDGRALAALASGGDPAAVDELARAGRAVGVALASAAALLDVDRIVVGGGFSRSGPALWEPLQAAFAAHARLDFLARTTVVPSALGEHAGVLGAAALVLAASS